MTDGPTTPGSRQSAELAAVEAVARDYIEGWYRGDVELMDRALHDHLVKRTPDAENEASDGHLRTLDKRRMLELTASGGAATPDANYQILVDDISNDVATVRLLSAEYLDYLHVARTPDGWRIVNILFRDR